MLYEVITPRPFRLYSRPEIFLETVGSAAAPRFSERTKSRILLGETAMADLPLMPKATAVWLVDNTTLTFRQIAEFTGMHELEISGIADGEVAVGIKGMDPITNHQLSRERNNFV